MTASIWIALLAGIFIGYCFGRAWAAHLDVKRLDSDIAALEAFITALQARSAAISRETGQCGGVGTEPAVGEVRG